MTEIEHGTTEQLTNRVAKGGGIVVVGSLIGKCFTFLTQVSLARVLGASRYGLYALGFSVVSLARPFASLGLEQGVVRFGSLYKGEKDIPKIKGTFISALLMPLISSFLIGALLLVFSRLICMKIFSAPDLIPVLRIFAVSFPFYILVLVTASIARALGEMHYFVGIENIFLLGTRIFFVGLALLLGFRLNGAVCGFLVSAILTAAFGLHSVRKIFPEILSKMRASCEVKRLLRFSLPLFFVGMTWMISSRIDRLMLGHFGSPSDVGIYSAAAIISKEGMFLMAAFNSVFAPIVSDLHNRGKRAELERLCKTVSRWILTTSLPLLLVLAHFSGELLRLSFGAEFARGWLVLVIFAVTNLPNICGAGPSGVILQMCGKQDIILINNVAMVAVNVTLNFWLIPIYGLLGAAIAIGVSRTLEGIARLLEINAFLGIHPFDKKYLKPVSSGTAALAMALFIKARAGTEKLGLMGLVIAVSTIMVVYVLILCAFGLDTEDRTMIGTMRKKLLRCR